ncbi:MAG: M23 family metallopeptidase, partial [Pyrinomonadaceae bacterium]
PRARILVAALFVFAAIGALVWFLSARYRTSPVTPVELPPVGTSPDAPANQQAPTPAATAPAALPAVSPAASPVPESTPAAQATLPEGAPAEAFPAPFAPSGSVQLLIPVAGIKPEQLRDTYNEARSAGRTHNAIDIIAPRGTPVLAAADGRVVKLFNSVPGGITLYQLSADEKMIYYYAHLDRYADNLSEGHLARRGEIIAYVGDTGNAGAGNFHLHFSVSLVSDPKRYWDGTNINPYPLLK